MHTFDEQYEICAAARHIRLISRDVVPGDVFFAVCSKIPAGGLRRRVWEVFRFLELHAPKLLPRLVDLGAYTRWADDLERITSTELDGNAYAAEALARGATHVFVDNPGVVRDARYILVPNAGQRLYELARRHRAKLDIPIVAVTGSVGKTTSKELIAAVLRRRGRVFANPGTLNSTWQVPAHILGLRAEMDDYAVIELGGLAPGTIAAYCEVVRPQCGVLTRIGIAHLETYGSIEGIRKGKWELVEYLAANGGHFFVNAADEWIRSQPAIPGRTTAYGSVPPNAGESGFVCGEYLAADPFLRFRWYPPDKAPVEIETKLFGRYNFENALAAAAVGLHFGIPAKEIAAAIAGCPPAENRSQLVQQGSNTFILDSGSVTPTSLDAALDNFDIYQAGPKVVILADMLRLGAGTLDAHRAVIARVRELDFAQVVFVGENYWQARDRSFGLYFRSTPALRRWWSRQHFSNTHFLIKGAIRFKLVEVLGVKPPRA